MKESKVAFILFFVFLLAFAACSDDDSNPTSNTPATVGVYSGSSSLDTTMTITVSNINGTAYVTGYSINYKNSAGTIRGNYGETNSEGLALVASNSFSYSVGSESDEILIGTINEETMVGSFKFPSSSLSSAIVGTFTITKN